MFITAFLRPKTDYRSVDVYFQKFELLSNTGIPILLFLDEVYCDRIFPSNVRIVPTTLNTSWIPHNVQLPAHRNPKKDTVEYFSIQLSKLYYLTEARKYTDDEFLAWIDFGAFHMFQDIPQCIQNLKTIAESRFPTTTILAPGCWPSGNYDWNSVCWRFCGTFLIGHRDLFPIAFARQQSLVMNQLPKLTWEVNYWAQMDDLFTVYMANHDDTLLSRVIVFVQRHQGVSM